MYRSLLPILCLLTLLYACGDGLEKKETTDALGFKTVSQFDPETGQQQGITRQYDPQGNLVAEEHYLNNELHGTRLLYAPDGTVLVEENYQNGAFAGPYSLFDEEGQLSLRGEYIDGKMAGAWTAYYPDGTVKEVVTFADNNENGPFREWYENGQPKASGSYLDGDKEHGTLHLYTEEGELRRVMECNRGMCKTTWEPGNPGDPPAGPDMIQPPALGEATK
jgi:antitoxin component YwqK of YwqJK toxin-antitoxin module